MGAGTSTGGSLAAYAEPRDGVSWWLHGYAAMVRWHLVSLRLWAATATAIEILSGVGMVYGIGLLAPHLSTRGMLYATTGPAIVALILLGLIFGPQLVAQEKMAGRYEYMLTMPVPRSAAALAWYTVTLLIGLPAAAVTIAAGMVRFGISLSPSAQLIPALLLGTFAITMAGYALAHAISKPMATILITQVLVFVAFGYAPINFPSSQMPHWLIDINRALPFLPIANVVRAGLTRGLATDVGVSYLVLAAWAIGSGWLAVLALGRRR